MATKTDLDGCQTKLNILALNVLKYTQTLNTMCKQYDTIRYNTIYYLHWKTDRQAASL